MRYYKAFRIDSRTWRIEDVFKTYMYVLEGENRSVLIDSGNGFPGLAECVRSLTSKEIIVINTHGHLDHIGGNNQFSNIYMSEKDREVAQEHLEKGLREKSLLGFQKEMGIPLSETDIHQIVNEPWDLSFKRMADHQVFDLGGRTLEILFTPGHTKGSLCVLDQERRQLFSGDTVCAIGILMLFEHSATIPEFLESIQHLEERIGDFDRIWPGHHSIPLKPSILSEYEGCAKQIMQRPQEGKKIRSNLGEGRIQYKDSISITYREKDCC